MAQIAYESAGFGGLVESVDYRDPDVLLRMFPAIGTRFHAIRLVSAGPIAIANCVYSGVNGNGSEGSGDGYRYRGRGFLLIVGKAAYGEAERYSGWPIAVTPELLGDPTIAASVAARFWATVGGNHAADANAMADVTALVAGPALPGLTERTTWLQRAQTIWS